MSEALYFRVLVGLPLPGQQALPEAGAFDASKDVETFTVEEEAGRPSKLTMNILDPHRVNSAAFERDLMVEILLGTTAEHSLVFRGIVHSSDATFGEGQVPTLKIEAHDRLQSLGERARSRVFFDLTLHRIVEAIGAEHDLEVKVDPAAPNPGYGENGLRQHAQTDLAFLLDLAEQAGCLLYVDAEDRRDVLRFEAQQTAMARAPKAEFAESRRGHVKVLDFNAKVETQAVPRPRHAAAMDPQTMKPSEVLASQVETPVEPEDDLQDENLAAFALKEPARAAPLFGLMASAARARLEKAGSLGSRVDPVGPPMESTANLRERMKHNPATKALGETATAKVEGDKDARVASTVEFINVGARSGVWFVAQARHVVDWDGYRIEMQCSR